VPLYVHGAPNGPLPPEILEQVAADINDSTFLSSFQKGLGTSITFRGIEITPGNYGESGMQEDLVKALVDLNRRGNILGMGISLRRFHPTFAVQCVRRLIGWFQVILAPNKLDHVWLPIELVPVVWTVFRRS